MRFFLRMVLARGAGEEPFNRTCQLAVCLIT